MHSVNLKLFCDMKNCKKNNKWFVLCTSVQLVILNVWETGCI